MTGLRMCCDQELLCMMLLHQTMHLQEGAQDFWKRALDKEFVAMQHELHFAVVPSGVADESFDVIRQLHLKSLPASAHSSVRTRRTHSGTHLPPMHAPALSAPVTHPAGYSAMAWKFSQQKVQSLKRQEGS